MTVNWANESDAVLITARDADAFATFYRRHAQGVLTFHARRTPSAELAADLTAETFAAALAGAERFDPERGEPVQWLYGIARHLLARALERGAADLRARKRLGIGRIELEDEMLERIEELASHGCRPVRSTGRWTNWSPACGMRLQPGSSGNRITRRSLATPVRRRLPHVGVSRAGWRRCAKSWEGRTDAGVPGRAGDGVAIGG